MLGEGCGIKLYSSMHAQRDEIGQRLIQLLCITCCGYNLHAELKTGQIGTLRPPNPAEIFLCPVYPCPAQEKKDIFLASRAALATSRVLLKRMGLVCEK